jgi:hypothetical protein
MVSLGEAKDIVKKLAVKFPSRDFFLFGSVVRMGFGNDIDIMIEIEELEFAEHAISCNSQGLYPFPPYFMDSDDLYWTYFSPRRARTKLVAEMLGISLEEFIRIIHNILKLGPKWELDIIFLPKNWREKKILCALKKFTDPYDVNFFENLERDLIKV